MDDLFSHPLARKGECVRSEQLPGDSRGEQCWEAVFNYLITAPTHIPVTELSRHHKPARVL